VEEGFLAGSALAESLDLCLGEFHAKDKLAACQDSNEGSAGFF
jgi:hypothetical protein